MSIMTASRKIEKLSMQLKAATECIAFLEALLDSIIATDQRNADRERELLSCLTGKPVAPTMQGYWHPAMYAKNIIAQWRKGEPIAYTRPTAYVHLSGDGRYLIVGGSDSPYKTAYYRLRGGKFIKIGEEK